MDREINIHQVLHGYHNGHQLLASSIDFSFSDRRLLDSMSDGAGIDSSSSINSYITGYALLESQKYVLARTWYADDMVRPGCVWTHSLIFNINDIRKITYPTRILELFHRPVGEKYDEYIAPIVIEQNCAERYIEAERLQYIVYTIYGTDKPRYIEIFDDSYIESVIWSICRMPIQLLIKFSFCSNSLVNRFIDGTPFSYQMVLKDRIYRVCTNTIANKVYQQREGVQGSPAWAREYAKAIVSGRLYKIENFMEIFRERIKSFCSFNQLLRLYFITREIGKPFSPYDYYNILTKLSEDDCSFYFECILKELIYGNYFDGLFLDYFMEMIDIADKNKRKLKKEDIDKLVKKILNKKIEKVPELLNGYIHGTVSKQAANIAKTIIMQAKPENLKLISNMNHDIVVVAVATNNKLIMSPDIWRLPRDYQCDIINVLDAALSYNEWVKILSLIIAECKEDIADAVYDKAQEKLVPALLELLCKLTDVQHIEKIYIWDKYLLEDQIKLTQNLLKILQVDLRKHYLLKIDTFNYEIRNAISLNDWIKIYKSCSFESYIQKVEIAIKLLPLILKDNLSIFPDVDMVSFVFTIIHQALAESQVSYEEWSLFENMLPMVDVCYAWDKCLRLRLAFEEKGYQIDKLFQGTNNIY